MLIYIFIIPCVLNTSFATDLLTALWEHGDDNEEKLVFRSLKGERLSHDDNILLIKRLSSLPFTDYLKTNFWHKIVRYRSIQSMDVSDWETYEPLIPYLPPSLLEEVNFSDPKVLLYFGQREFKESQLSQLAEGVTQALGDVLSHKEKIPMLGNIFCGFTVDELSKIEESTLRFLYENEFFKILNSCSQQQLSAVARLLMEFKVVGPPRTWKTYHVKQMGSLIAGLSPQEMREIQEAGFSEINPQIIDLTPADTLRQLKTTQVKRFDRSTLLSWRRKTRDMRKISLSSYSTPNVLLVSVMTAFLLVGVAGRVTNYYRPSALKM